MKTLKTLFVLLLCLTTAATRAQPASKQKLFTNYPETIQLSKNILQNALTVNEGEEVVITFSNEFSFKGTVLSNQKKYDNLQSVMIRSAVFKNAILQLSRIINADKSISYAGRIINPEAGDGYQVKKGKDNTYSLVKFETNKILQDCSY